MTELKAELRIQFQCRPIDEMSVEDIESLRRETHDRLDLAIDEILRPTRTLGSQTLGRSP